MGIMSNNERITETFNKMEEIKKFKLYHCLEKGNQINVINEVLETYGLTIKVIDITEEYSEYKIDVLK